VLAVLVHLDAEFASFRRGLVLQLLGRHVAAYKEFQRALRADPGNAVAWEALGQSYLTLNRVTSARAAAEELRARGWPALECRIAVLLERPLPPVADRAVERTPFLALSFLTRAIAELRRFRFFCRFEA
jgi:tetratricopeptide (TPR) repeat protein